MRNGGISEAPRRDGRDGRTVPGLGIIQRDHDVAAVAVAGFHFSLHSTLFHDRGTGGAQAEMRTPHTHTRTTTRVTCTVTNGSAAAQLVSVSPSQAASCIALKLLNLKGLRPSMWCWRTTFRLEQMHFPQKPQPTDKTR